MTNHLPPPSDEDLSAALDGEADADAQARIAAHPDSARRSAQLEQAATLLASSAVPELDDETADRLIDNALRSPIAPGQPARNARPARWLVAAAVALLVGIGLTLVWTGRDNGDDQAFSTVANSISEEDGASVAENDQSPSEPPLGPDGDLEEGSAAGGTAADIGPLLHLGRFESGDALRRALATTALLDASQPRSPAAVVTREASVARCAEQLSVALDLPTQPLAHATAVVDGTDVFVYEFAIDSFDDGQPTTLVAAVDTEACAQVVVFER